MFKIGLIGCVTIAILALGNGEVAAAQKKKPAPQSQTKSKVSPYELCKQLVAKHGGAELRVQRYQITKDGVLKCWYMA